MSRAYNVALGCVLIATIWIWAFGATLPARGWMAPLVLVCNIATACLLTAPVYREYLK